MSTSGPLIMSCYTWKYYEGRGILISRPRLLTRILLFWASEFDTTLNMGKAVTHRFQEGNQEWNYDGRSGFATTFHFTSD